MEEINNLMEEMICYIEQIPIDTGKKKKVKFNFYNYCVLIPCKNELIENNLVTQIWWSQIDFWIFRNNATNELREFLYTFPQADYKYYAKNLWYELDFDKIYSDLECCENLLLTNNKESFVNIKDLKP
jgi:hypothetical protein